MLLWHGHKKSFYIYTIFSLNESSRGKREAATLVMKHVVQNMGIRTKDPHIIEK